MPSLTEQVAEQVGGVRGITEASIPVAVFVVLNIITELRPALYASVATALAIAAYRLARRQPIRHAVNGLFGIGLGAVLVLRSGQARDFHLTTILWSLGYGIALLLSTLARWPLVGFIWSVTFGGGDTTWRGDRRLRRLFGWLTAAWAAVYLIKSAILFVLWQADRTDALGIARLILGYPVYAAVLGLTVLAVRRAVRRHALEDATSG